MEVVELAGAGESGSGGSSGGGEAVDGVDDNGDTGIVVGLSNLSASVCCSRLLMRSSSDGRAFS